MVAHFRMAQNAERGLQEQHVPVDVPSWIRIGHTTDVRQV